MLISHLFAAKPVPFGPRHSLSSISKQAHKQLTITTTGAIEDEQGNKKLHGGPEKALHQFSQTAYKHILAEFPSLANKAMVGSIGENISCDAMDDSNIFIGDIFQFGDVILQVNAPRAPCVKINQQYATKGVDRFVGEQGYSGWYYRVLTPGIISLGDRIKRIGHNTSSMSVQCVMKLAHSASPDLNLIEEAVTLEGLDPEWQKVLTRRRSKG